jgi:hypothetical protein
LIKKNLKNWEECIPHAEFAYNRAKHSSTLKSPFMVVYGFEPLTALDILPLPLHERTNMDVEKRAEYMKKIHEETRKNIERQVQRQAKSANKHKKLMRFEEGDLVWIHLRKERFPQERNSKLKPRADGPFKILKRINDNAYVIDLPASKYNGSNTFNVADLSPFHGDEDDLESRTTLSEGGGDDAARGHDATTPTPPSPPSGPMTRSRVKALQEQVNSLLNTDGFGTDIPSYNTLCLLKYEPQELHQHGGGDGQGTEEEEEELPDFRRKNRRRRNCRRNVSVSAETSGATPK